ncbi:MAG TPA: type II toxin-antitoxin system VapC family toxin [Steroidobacteraceae bacterium]|nr:type II toxin-antitoxin system VapC family toxin [Steroidobacteraceae bacterium]
MRPRYLLDTNICIYLLKGERTSIIDRVSKCSVGEAVMSSITYAELMFGVAVSSDPGRESKAVARLIDAVPAMPFGAKEAQAYAGIRKATPDRKADALDKLIAAHAAALGVVLITNNEGDFSRYPGIKVENWARA